MNAKQKFVVYSDGYPLSGFSKNEVVEGINGLFAIPKDKIEQRLLAGDSSKIKSFEDLASAEALMVKLRHCGLSCKVISTKSSFIFSRTGGVSKAGSNQENKLGFFRKLALPVALTLVLATLSYSLIVSFLVNNTVESVPRVEAALFSSQDPDAILHTDLAQIMRLLSLADDQDLNETAEKAIVSAPLLSPWKTRVTKQEDELSPLFLATDAFTASMSLPERSKGDAADNNDELGLVIVLQGDYSNLDVKKELSNFYQVESPNNDILTLLPKASVDNSITECNLENASEETERLPTAYARISQGVIALASTKAALVAFEEAYAAENDQQKDANRVIDWQRYRNTSVFAMSVFDDNLMHRDFSTAIASKVLFDEHIAQTLSVRVMAKPIQRTLLASIDAVMNEPNAATVIAEKIRSDIRDLSEKNEDAFPAVVDLLSRLDISSDKALHIEAKLNKQIVGELESLISEFFEMAFASVGEPNDNTELLTEEIDKHSWDYSLNDTLFTPVKIESDRFTDFSPMFVREGVSIYLESMKMESPLNSKDSQENVLQLNYSAKRSAPFGDAFFGWSRSGIKQSLEILDVGDKSGKSLLADERCVESSAFEKRNHEPNESSNYSNGLIQTTKTVRLIDSATVEKVGIVRGRYNITVPIKVVDNKLDLTNPVAEWPGGSFHLTEIKDGRISYVLRGDESYLLEVRGLNAQGKPLKFASSFGLSNGKRRTKNFKGEVTSVELKLASQFEQQSFDFETNGVFPQLLDQAPNNSLLREPVSFSKAELSRFSKTLNFEALSDQEADEFARKLNWQDFSLDATNEHELGSVIAGPAALFFSHDESVEWGQKLRGAILLPHDPSLHSLIDAVELVLTLDNDEQKSAFVDIAVTTQNGELRPSVVLKNVGYDIGFFELSFDEQRAAIGEISGALIFRFPTKIDSTTLKLSDAEQIALTAYDFSWGGKVAYQLKGDAAESFYGIIASKNEDLGGSKARAKDGSTELEFTKLPDYSQLESLRLYKVSESTVKREAFSFIPSYK